MRAEKEKIVFTFDEVMREMGIVMDNGFNKGMTPRENQYVGVNTKDLARLGAEILRLRIRIEKLERRKRK